MDWQPSWFLTDRAEAKRAFQLAEQLGSVKAAEAEPGTTWPWLPKAFIRHGLACRSAIRRRSANGPSPRPGNVAGGWPPPLDPVFMALNPGVLPARERSAAELYEWVRRDEEYATLGTNVFVELRSESHARRPRRAPGRSFAASNALTATPLTVQTVPAPAGRPNQPQRPHQPVPPTRGVGVVADAR